MANLWRAAKRILEAIRIRLKSWPMWIAMGALTIFVVMQITGTDISTPVNSLLVVFLPVLVGFGIVNDPTIRSKLFGNGIQYWYQSKAMWVAILSLVAYIVKLIFGVDINETVSGLLDVALPVLMAAGVVISPTGNEISE